MICEIAPSGQETVILSAADLSSGLHSDRIADVGFAYHSEVVFVVSPTAITVLALSPRRDFISRMQAPSRIGRKNFAPYPSFVKAEYAAVFGFKPLPQPMIQFSGVSKAITVLLILLPFGISE